MNCTRNYFLWSDPDNGYIATNSPMNEEVAEVYMLSLWWCS